MMTFDFPQAMQPLVQTATAAQSRAAGAVRHIDYSHHPPSPKRICRAGAGRGQPSGRGGPGKGKSCNPCTHAKGSFVSQQGGHVKHCN